MIEAWIWAEGGTCEAIGSPQTIFRMYDFTECIWEVRPTRAVRYMMVEVVSDLERRWYPIALADMISGDTLKLTVKLKGI